jgi:hypothetical protein
MEGEFSINQGKKSLKNINHFIYFWYFERSMPNQTNSILTTRNRTEKMWITFTYNN